MSDSDNPFAASSHIRADLDGGPERFEPVPLDVMPILERCWEIVKRNPGLVVGALLIPLVPAFAFAGLDMAVIFATEAGEVDRTLGEVARVTSSLFNNLINLFFQLGAIQIYMRLARGQEADLGLLLAGGPYLLRGIGAGILMGLAVVLGFLMLFIPGIIASIGLQFTLYAMVDRNLGPIEAVTASWALTDGFKGSIFAINILVGLGFLAVTCLTLGLGYFLALPVLVLVQAVMYHSLTHIQKLHVG